MQSMEAAHPEAGKANLIIVLFTQAFPDALKIQNYTSTILSQPAKQDRLLTASRSNPQQFNFTTSTILEGKQDFPHTPCCCNCLTNRNRKTQAVLGALGEKTVLHKVRQSVLAPNKSFQMATVFCQYKPVFTLKPSLLIAG